MQCSAFHLAKCTRKIKKGSVLCTTTEHSRPPLLGAFDLKHFISQFNSLKVCPGMGIWFICASWWCWFIHASFKTLPSQNPKHFLAEKGPNWHNGQCAWCECARSRFRGSICRYWKVKVWKSKLIVGIPWHLTSFRIISFEGVLSTISARSWIQLVDLSSPFGLVNDRDKCLKFGFLRLSTLF